MVIPSDFTYFPAPAKINLMLRIVSQEASGYHNLQTIFQFTNLVDYLGIKATKSPTIECNYHNETITPQNDLILKAAYLLQQETKTNQGAAITLTKNIPTGAGLGGGSSNAATALVALNQLWNLSLSNEALQKLGAQLGADVPIFIYGKSAWAEGIGDQFYPINPPTKCYWLIIPPINISTATIFQSPVLSRNNPPFNKDHYNFSNYVNDCTSAIFNHYPLMKEYIEALTMLNLEPRITGTGACIYIDEPTDQHLINKIQLLAEQYYWRLKPFSTLNQSPLIGNPDITH